MKTLHEWIAKGAVSSEIAEKYGYTELVRCKDCRWGEPAKNAYGEDRIICGNDDTYIDRYITVPADWFCADGERNSADEILMEKMDADPLG